MRTNGVVAGLHVLPEMDVGVVEDVDVQVHVVEALRAQHHGHVIATVQQRNCAQEELLLCHLQIASLSLSQPCSMPFCSIQASSPMPREDHIPCTELCCFFVGVVCISPFPAPTSCSTLSCKRYGALHADVTRELLHDTY